MFLQSVQSVNYQTPGYSEFVDMDSYLVDTSKQILHYEQRVT
jgi:hypothetical protein